MQTGLTLNSWEFLLLSLFAITIFRISRTRVEREGFLVLFNVYFLYHFLQDINSILTLIAILGLTYGLGRYRKNLGIGQTSLVSAIVIIGLWGILFLIKDPNLLAPINFFSFLDIRIIGISYIVFRCISFVIEIQPRTQVTFFGFVSYVTFFPTILAGPIERFTVFNTQLVEPKSRDEVDVGACLHRICNGMIKKFVLADNLSIFGIHAMQQTPDNFAVGLLWLGALSQLFLIYLDFSGYCDIVIGISRLMGIRIRENFNSPFIAKNIQEFWERWHISLSSFVKDYVFSPMIKVIFKLPATVQPTLVMASYFFTMILIALWHGTTVGFLVFGLVHGAALLFIQVKQKYVRNLSLFSNVKATRIGINILSPVLTYSFVSLSLALWITSSDQWQDLFNRMFGI